MAEKKITKKRKWEDSMIPSDDSIEQVVLGTLLVHSDLIHSWVQDFNEELFFNHECRSVAQCIIELYRKSEAIDMITVVQMAKTLKKDDVVKPYFVAGLTNRVGSSANFDEHFRILQQYALRRNLIFQCGKTLQTAYDDSEDIFDLYADTSNGIDKAMKKVINYQIEKVNSIHNEILDKALELSISGHKSGVESGLTMVDNLTNGWQESDLIILAGRPSMGKTAAAITMTMYPAIQQNIPIGIFSLEMSSSQLVSRMQSMLSEVNVGKIVKKQLTVEEIEQIRGKANYLEKAPIYIDDTPNLSLMALKGKSRKMVKESGVKLIIIDYLQLMRSGVKTQSREQEIAEISRGLKAIAKELSVPIMALSQLSRAVENRGGDRKPVLSDLRESGQIEQDADMVMFCYRPEYYDIDEYEIDNTQFETKGLFMLLIAKHRNGELGEIPLTFIHEQTKLTNHKFPSNSFDHSDYNSTFVQQRTNQENEFKDDTPF